MNKSDYDKAIKAACSAQIDASFQLLVQTIKAKTIDTQIAIRVFSEAVTAALKAYELAAKAAPELFKK